VTDGQSSSPEELLSQLVQTVPVPAACIPLAVRSERPRLDAVARRHSIETSDRPLGHEDLVCLIADPDAVRTLEQVDDLLAAFRAAPYVLLVTSSSDRPDTAVVAGRELLASHHGWVMRDVRCAAGPALLAPAWRLLEAGDLAGHWYGRPAAPLDEPGEEPDPGEHDELLAALWAGAERDRHAIAAIAQQQGARPGGEPGSASGVITRYGLSGLPLGAPRSELDRLRLERLEERAWVAEQARRIAASSSWRVGHRFVRMARWLTFRRDRGTNLPLQIAERMEESEAPGITRTEPR
jgi:hypothetical protein